MKKTLLILSAMAVAASAYADTFSCVADTWIRSNNLTWKDGAKKATVEVRMEALKDESGAATGEYAYFVALYGFNYQLPAGKKVQEATLRLVTERWKGSDVSVYGYTNNFDETGACWETEGQYVEDAIFNGEITHFSPAAQRNKALGSDEIGDDYKEIGAWTNEINVTNYLKSLPATATRVNFLLAQTATDNVNQNCFYTKECEGVVNAKDESLSFSAEEVIPVLYVTFADDTDSSLDTLSPLADTYVRSNAAGNNFASAGEMEVYTQDKDGEMLYFVGLMSFQLPAELLSDSYQLTGASLRIVTTQCKGDRNMGIYRVGSFAENTTWNAFGTDVLDAIDGTPDVTFEVVGQGNKALNAKDAISDDYASVEKWTNTVDLTDLVKAVVADKASVLNFAIAKTQIQTNNNAVKFATKENEGANGVKEDGTTFTFPAADVVPQLTIAYSKVEAGVADLDAEAGAPVEYFNLQGIRVANPERGNIYIVRQGSSVKKVIL